VGRGRHGAQAQDRSRRADEAIEACARNLIQVFARLMIDVPQQLSFIARAQRVGPDEFFGQANHAELEAATQLDVRSGTSRDFDAATPDVDDHHHVARRADSVDGCAVNEPRFFGARDDFWANACFLRDRMQEFAAVFGFARGARCYRDDFVHPMRLREPCELGQDLEGGMHRFRCQRAAAETAGAQADHLFFTIDHFEGQIRSHADNDHVQRIGPDIDGGDPHAVGLLPRRRGQPWVIRYNRAAAPLDHVGFNIPLRTTTVAPQPLYTDVAARENVRRADVAPYACGIPATARVTAGSRDRTPGHHGYRATAAKGYPAAR
jgi:hypothetical protein